MKIIILDTETTGNREEDKIIQLSFLVMNRNLEIEEIHDTLANPGIPISFEAMAVHHITNEMIEDKPKLKFTDVYKRLKELNSPENVVVIHNAEFDLEMLKKEGFNPFFQVIDTFRILKHLIKESKYSLQYNRYALGLYKKEKEICEKYNIKINAHDALGDVVVLGLLLQYLVKEFDKTVDELIELTKKPVLYDKFYQGKYKYENIRDILIKDPDYIEYMLSLTDLDPDVKYSIEHHLENLDIEPEYRFGVGKYKGMLIQDVAEIDIQYLSWAYHNMKMSKGMRKKIGEILSS
ncbi:MULTISPECIES: 3'-5' exonuclease [unclassified Lebetimonas]|uniref:3'-5' exonuclease n=1 Tax=unclassified Lebetimonas TaxID=2648158 RepID=UPI0004650348|nr:MULTISPECIES: 3'-5' exonuclease [unclassified Lebetimonas]